MIHKKEIKELIKQAGLTGQCLCLHSSYKSIGDRVEGGPAAIIEAFIEEGCTIMMPTFSYVFLLDKDRSVSSFDNEQGFSTDSNVIDPGMGILPKMLLENKGRIRGYHPLDSFTALGPKAHELISSQSPIEIYGPLKALAQAKGFVSLLGVNLNRMTLLHYCEQLAGRELFPKKTLVKGKGIVDALIGECSEGFLNLMACLEEDLQRYHLGKSPFLVFSAEKVIKKAAAVIRENPEITRCSPGCPLCEQSIAGQK